MLFDRYLLDKEPGASIFSTTVGTAGCRERFD